MRGKVNYFAFTGVRNLRQIVATDRLGIT